jgi:hypothetical protein
MITKTIQKTIFATFTKPTLVLGNFPNNYHIITSIQLNETNDLYDYKTTCDFLNLYGIKKIVIITIVKNPKIFEIKINNYKGKKDTTIIEYLIPSVFFWTYSGLTKFIFFNKEKGLKEENEFQFFNDFNLDTITPYFIIYKFEDTSWFEIVSLFKFFNITISGGSTVKRHINSVIVAQLNLFLICLERENFMKKTWNSFHNVSRISHRIWYDYNLSIEEVNTCFNRWESIVKNEEERKEIIEYANKPYQINYIINLVEVRKIIDILKLIKTKLELDKAQENNEKIEENSNISNEISNENLNNNSNSNNTSNNINNSPLKNNLLGQGQKREFHTSNSFKIKRNFHTTSYVNRIDSKIKDNIKNKDKIKEKKEKKIIDYKVNDNTNLFLNEIKEILIDPNLTDRQKQWKIENSWIEIIAEELTDPQILLQKYGQKLHKYVSEATETLNLHFDRDLLKKFPFLINLGKKNIEYMLITFSLVISNIFKQKFTSLACYVGKTIVYWVYKKSLKNNLISEDLSLSEFYTNNEIKEETILKLGSKFILLYTQIPQDLFEITHERESYNRYHTSIIKINEKYLDYITNNLIIHPFKLPMVCEPNHWSEKDFGGYMSNLEMKDQIITGSFLQGHQIKKNDIFYDTINYLNKIKFKINNKLLEYIKNEGKFLIDKIPINQSLKLQKDITLKIADCFSNYKDPIYLTVIGDWRGRIYTQSFFLDYQGQDLSSALLNFYEGEKITQSGLEYLYVFGANNHNERDIKKRKYADRINWVKRNYDKIINLDEELILSAENPFTFTSFCLTMKEIHENPNTLVNIPIFLDATQMGRV